MLGTAGMIVGILVESEGDGRNVRKLRDCQKVVELHTYAQDVASQ